MKIVTRFSRREFLSFLALATGAALLGPTVVAAADDATAASAAERRKRWESLPADEKEKLREAYRRYQGLPPERQARLQAELDKMKAAAKVTFNDAYFAVPAPAEAPAEAPVAPPAPQPEAKKQ